MATINKSNTLMSEKDYWRTSSELIRDALKLLNIDAFDTDVCCKSTKEQIAKTFWCIEESKNALSKGTEWFSQLHMTSYCTTSFCNPPFSKKWQFFQKAVEQVNKWGKQVLMVMPYTPMTKEWRENVSKANCIIYRPDGRYQFLLPDGTRPKNSCSFETCLILIVPFKLGCVTVDYERGLDE